MYFETGDTYNGYWAKGMMHGPCKVKLSDGRKYHGKFVKGAVASVGAVVYPDGKKYEGHMQDYIPNGYGKMTYASGSWFDGEWIGGVKIDKNGTTFDAPSKEGKVKPEVANKPVDSIGGLFKTAFTSEKAGLGPINLWGK